MPKTTGHIYKVSSTVILYVYRVGVALGLVFVAYSAYRLIVADIFKNDRYLIPFILLWLLTSYVVLPRVHRFLTKLYVPDYFVGRTRTGDGFLGDPVNLAFNGSEESIHRSMEAAGWVRAEPLSWRSSLDMVKNSVLKRSYPNAPVSSLFLFSRKQNFAYQQEVDGTPHERHHVRFWKTPKQWWLPGGYKADWIAAATYDTHVGISTLTGQITHKIEENIDIERDYLISTLQDAGVVKSLRVEKHFTSAFRDKNGGGDQIETDGSLPFISL